MAYNQSDARIQQYIRGACDKIVSDCPIQKDIEQRNEGFGEVDGTVFPSTFND